MSEYIEEFSVIYIIYTIVKLPLVYRIYNCVLPICAKRNTCTFIDNAVQVPELRKKNFMKELDNFIFFFLI